MTTVNLINKGYNPTNITYISSFGSRSVVVNGGASLAIVNTASAEDPTKPDNQLNLDPIDHKVNKSNFRYDKSAVSISIDTV